MPKPRSADGRTPEHELLDILVAQAALVVHGQPVRTLREYASTCRRRNDSWRVMAEELTAKLGRDINHAWLHANLRDDPVILAAEQAYAAEQSARFIPVGGGAE